MSWSNDIGHPSDQSYDRAFERVLSLTRVAERATSRELDGQRTLVDWVNAATIAFLVFLLELGDARGAVSDHARHHRQQAASGASGGLDAVADVEQVALLHDLGKIGIPDAILQKPGKLDAAEWEVMRQHPAIGAQMIASVASLSHLAPAVRAEHERFDGHGYPDRLAADRIPIESRIVFACDAYHAMISDRPYRNAMSEHDAQAELHAHAGSQFDPDVTAALLHVLGRLQRAQASGSEQVQGWPR